MQCLHLRQAFVAVLDRNTLSQLHKGHVDRLHSLALAGVSFGHQMEGLLVMWNVLVSGFGGFSKKLMEDANKRTFPVF